MTNTRNIPNKTMNPIKTITEDEHYTIDYNNNYNTAPGVSQENKCKRRPLSPPECEMIKEAYLQNISDTMTAAVAHLIEKAFDSGLQVDEIIMAIEETGMAKNPTPWYLKRILENWAENGVTVSRIRHLVGPNRALPWWK